MGSTNPRFIHSVCRSNNRKYIASGCEDGNLNIYHYPCISDNPMVDKYMYNKLI